MYEGYYRLATDPFRLTPDLAFRFAHQGYSEVFERLARALRRHEPLLVLTGEPGIGKTLLVHELLAAHGAGQVRCARLAAPHLDREDLVRAIALEFGLAGDQDSASLLQEFLLRQADANRRCILALDEAQELPPDALEQVAALSALRTAEGRPLLQILLAGQPPLSTAELERRLGPVAVACELGRMDAPETAQYVEHRLRRAGWQGAPAITAAALQAIHQLTQGVPRRINQACGRLLVLGATEGRHVLDAPDVGRVADDLHEEMLLDSATLARFGSTLAPVSAVADTPNPTPGERRETRAAGGGLAGGVARRPAARGRRVRYAAAGSLLSAALVATLFAGIHPGGLDALGERLFGEQPDSLTSRVAALGRILRFEPPVPEAEKPARPAAPRRSRAGHQRTFPRVRNPPSRTASRNRPTSRRRDRKPRNTPPSSVPGLHRTPRLSRAAHAPSGRTSERLI